MVPRRARWLESIEYLTVTKKMTQSKDIATADFALLEPVELSSHSIPPSVHVVGPACVVYGKARNRALPKQSHPVLSYKVHSLVPLLPDG